MFFFFFTQSEAKYQLSDLKINLFVTHGDCREKQISKGSFSVGVCCLSARFLSKSEDVVIIDVVIYLAWLPQNDSLFNCFGISPSSSVTLARMRALPPHPAGKPLGKPT